MLPGIVNTAIAVEKNAVPMLFVLFSSGLTCILNWESMTHTWKPQCCKNPANVLLPLPVVSWLKCGKSMQLNL